MAELISESKYHRTIDGTVLARMREDAGFSQEEFAGLVAKEAGRESLSRQYIAQIEAPGMHEVHVDIAEAVRRAVSCP